MVEGKIKGPTLRERLFSSRAKLNRRAEEVGNYVPAIDKTPAEMTVMRLKARETEDVNEMLQWSLGLADRMEAIDARAEAYRQVADAPRILRPFVRNRQLHKAEQENS